MALSLAVWSGATGPLPSAAQPAPAPQVAAPVALPPVDIDTVFGPTCDKDGDPLTNDDPLTNAPPEVYFPGFALHLKTVDNANFPAARCNDGTPGAYYVHRATDPADEDKWVIYLEGGFSCNHYEECRQRWCDEDQPAADVNAQKMSSRWLAPTIAGTGILYSVGPALNALSSWNHVLVHYCSSDRWTGSKGRTSLSDGTDEAVISFRGRNILRATVNELLDAAGVTADDGHTMPSLGGAAIVLWTGTSAGGVGAVQSANAARNAIAAASPNVDFRLIVDSAYGPSDPLWDAPAAALALCGFPHQQANWNVQLDSACEAAHPDSKWECTTREVLLNHVTFPFLVRQDLSDKVAVNGLTALVGATETDVIAATEAELLALNAVADASYYGSCTSLGGHVWLTTPLDYALNALAAPSPAGATTMNAAVADWIATGGPVRWYDVPVAATGECP